MYHNCIRCCKLLNLQLDNCLRGWTEVWWFYLQNMELLFLGKKMFRYPDRKQVMQYLYIKLRGILHIRNAIEGMHSTRT